MFKKYECPECGEKLLLKAKRCACGWQQFEKKIVCTDYSCQYQKNGLRCRLPGSICSSPYSNGPWYCRTHWLTDREINAIGDGENLEESYEDLFQNQLDWRRKLLNELSKK